MANINPASQYPIGTTSPFAFENNVSNLDDLLLGSSPSYPDRKLKRRQSWAGMEEAFQELLSQSGFESQHLTYIDGSPLVVSRQTQLIDRAGSVYRVKLPATFPLTLSGTWATDAPLLVDTGDQALRQELADPAGAQIVGGAQVTVSSFSGLRALATNKASKWAVISNERFLSFYRLDLADSTTPDDGGAVIAPNNGPGRWKLNYADSIQVDQFGVVPTPGVDNYVQLQKAVVFAWTNQVELRGGRGTYEYGTKLDLSYPTLVFRGAGFRNTVFKYTGPAGRAMEAIGTRPNHGIYSFDLDLSDFTIEGNANTTDLLLVRINHARLVRLNGREASSINGCAFRIGGTVAGHYEQLTMSTNTQPMVSRPQNGIVFETDPTLSGARATCNTLMTPCIEGAIGDGIYLNGCDQLTIVGGTSENNGGNGLTEAPGTQMCTYIGFDCEVNLGFADFAIFGQNSHLINCGSTRYTYIDDTVKFAKIEGGWFDKIEVGVGAVGVEISKVKTRFFGGAVGLVTHNNPFLSTKDIFDVQANAIVYFPKPARVIPFTGTGMVYTNVGPVDETILINPNGATITQLDYYRSGGSVGLMNVNTGCVRLQSGDGFRIACTGTPIMTCLPGGSNYL